MADLHALVQAALEAGDRNDHAGIDQAAPPALAAAAAAARDDLRCEVLGAWSQSAYRRNDFPLAARLAAKQARLDALRPLGITELHLPATPDRVWRLIQAKG